MSHPIGKKLKIIREKRGLTQMELAALARVSKAYIGHVERYGVVPSLAFALKLEVGLGLKRPELSGPICDSKGIDRRLAGKLLLQS